jgi:hypothetical protein
MVRTANYRVYHLNTANLIGRTGWKIVDIDPKDLWALL